MSKRNQKLVLDELTLELIFDKNDVKMIWSGVCENQEPELSISPFLQAQMSKLAGCNLIIDFLKCEYVNSASITLLFQLIKQLNARGIKTEILYNLEMEWQRITFRSVKIVTQTLPHITVVGSEI